jgi:D-tyrosyl-tRNA(Tyr) deacylase
LQTGEKVVVDVPVAIKASRHNGGKKLTRAFFGYLALLKGCGKIKKGNRPSYIRSAGEPVARPMYEKFLATLSSVLGAEVEHGEFGADMKVSLVNDGPVTICIDSKNRE